MRTGQHQGVGQKGRPEAPPAISWLVVPQGSPCGAPYLGCYVRRQRGRHSAHIIHAMCAAAPIPNDMHFQGVCLPRVCHTGCGLHHTAVCMSAAQLQIEQDRSAQAAQSAASSTYTGGSSCFSPSAVMNGCASASMAAKASISMHFEPAPSLRTEMPCRPTKDEQYTFDQWIAGHCAR